MTIEIAFSELPNWVGQQVAVSDWVTVDQIRINQFAEATGDHQWIHTDPARAATESPFGCTVAHGFLTLSLIPKLMQESLSVSGLRMVINYGSERVRFMAPVKVNSRLRAQFSLAALQAVGPCTQITWQVRLEIEGQIKPACIAELIVRAYPEDATAPCAAA